MYHGGLSKDDGRMKHGLYSDNAGDVLREKIQHAKKADVESMEDEINLMRAVTSKMAEGLDTTNPEEIERMVNLLDKVARNIERLHKIRYGEKNTITVQEVDVFVSIVMDAIQKNFERCKNADQLIEVIGTQLDKATEGALDEPADSRGGRR
jgi:NADP-dependent 3-hydroxy acid dehydrogenase YdfG